MTKKQFLEQYGKENTAVYCKTRELAKEFLKLCAKFNIKWDGKHNALVIYDRWDKHDKTCFCLNEGHSLTYESKSWCEDEEDYTIIPFEQEYKKNKRRIKKSK